MNVSRDPPSLRLILLLRKLEERYATFSLLEFRKNKRCYVKKNSSTMTSTVGSDITVSSVCVVPPPLTPLSANDKISRKTLQKKNQEEHHLAAVFGPTYD